MSLAIPSYSKTGLYVRARTGDIDQDPELTEIINSFFGEPDDHAPNNHLGVPEGRARGYSNVLTGIKDQSPPRSRFASFVHENPPLAKEYTAQEKMLQYQDGSYIRNCLKGRQNLNKGVNDINTQPLEDLRNNYRKFEDGTLQMINKESLKKQKQVFGFLVKQFGSALFSGKSLTTIALPIIIFRPMSALEAEARYNLNAPHFLEKAGTIYDIVEQFKLTVTHHIASLHLALGVSKPFNPILGETFQGIINGCPIYVEQIVHHPPISAMQMIGKNFRKESTTEFAVNMNISMFKLSRVGHQKVVFNNTNTTIRAQYPPWVLHSGLGKKTYQFENKLYVFDLGNKLYAEIVFDYEESTLFKKAKFSQDHFSGSIWRVNDKFIDVLKQLPKKRHDLDEIKFKEKEHAVQHIANLEGFWLEYLKIDGQVYWSLNEQLPYKMHYFDNPLPSDSNFRLDVLHLKEGDEARAQDMREKFEDVQRKDKKLREKYKKSHK